MAWTGLMILVSTMPGCVERELFLRSDPPGAVVTLDGQERGKTPLVLPFEYYGTRHLELRMEGYRVEQTLVEVSTPWYQVFPFDLFFDLLWPFTLEDVHTFDFTLTPFKAVGEEERSALLERAGKLKTK
jgi:hypothetical protein